MQNKVFIISDTHFGHKKVLQFEAGHRPFQTIEEHDAELVRRWNAVVNPKDTVWHLGDVYFGRDTHTILGKLHGRKKLILGNHDQYPLEIYQKYFTKIMGAFRYGKTLFTHVPIHPDQLQYRFTHNIHGHMHSKKLDDPRYICVAAEHLDLQPILLRELLESHHVY